MTKLTLSKLKRSAEATYRKWDRIYYDLVEKSNKAIFEAKRDKTTLPDHFWQSAHDARMRLQAAKGLLEVIAEIEKEEKENPNV